MKDDMDRDIVIENKDIKAVGDWLYGLLPPVELMKIVEHTQKVMEPDIMLNIKLSLFELESLHLFGHLPEKRNCFGVKNEIKDGHGERVYR